MISMQVGDVAHPLELVFLLIEGAVAAVRAQRISKSKATSGRTARALQIEVRHAGRVGGVQVQTGYACVLCWRRAKAVRVDGHAIPEEAESEISKPIGTDNVIHAVREALI